MARIQITTAAGDFELGRESDEEIAEMLLSLADRFSFGRGQWVHAGHSETHRLIWVPPGSGVIAEFGGGELPQSLNELPMLHGRLGRH